VADSITTNADLVTYEVLPDVEIVRLSTARLNAEDPPWATRHKLAWTKTLDRLGQRDPRIQENDIDDTSVLKYCVCCFVAYLAYRWAPAGEDDMKRAEWWHAQWTRELEEVRISDTIPVGKFQFRRSYRQ
jgi:hypothetical protein